MGLFKRIVKEATKPLVNNIKGKIGEAKVDSKLNPLLFGKVEHRQINNLILVDENGKSHQIDHVEIRENGIFCIETKNYKGWIYGGEKQDQWTQVLFNEKYQFLSPIKQNRSHVYQISEALNGKYKVQSLIVMAQNNADKINCSYVVNLDDLPKYLKNFDDGRKFSKLEMEGIYQTLLSSNVEMSNREHVKEIRRTQKELKEGICPRCGAKLIEKQGKYNPFYACSNYPKCTFTLKK